MIAVYLRISRDDGRSERSGSLLGQQMLVRGHLRRLADAGMIAPLGQERLYDSFPRSEGPLQEVVYFGDDGYSGLNLRRPAFQALMRECRAGAVSCVAVRDLSRLSRNYIDLGDLVEQVFPQLGVRFISVAEGIDRTPARGCGLSGDAGLSQALVSIVNNAYSIMLSCNVRESMRVRWLAGEHVQAVAPFGYVYDRKARGNLKIDPVAAGWVSAMFEMTAGGVAPCDIAEKLQSAGVPTPSAYALACGGPKAASCGGWKTPWSSSKVRYIVKREVYAGVLVGGSTQSMGVGRGCARRRTCTCEQVRKENAHAAIVTRGLFDAAQVALSKVPRGRPRRR